MLRVFFSWKIYLPFPLLSIWFMAINLKLATYLWCEHENKSFCKICTMFGFFSRTLLQSGGKEKKTRTHHWKDSELFIGFGLVCFPRKKTFQIRYIRGYQTNRIRLNCSPLRSFSLARSLLLNSSLPRFFSLFILVLALGEIQIFVHCYSSSRALSTEKSQYFLLEHLTEVKIFTLFRRCRKIYGFVCVLFFRFEHKSFRIECTFTLAHISSPNGCWSRSGWFNA